MKAKILLGIAFLLLISGASYGDDALGWDSLSKSKQEVIACHSSAASDCLEGPSTGPA